MIPNAHCYCHFSAACSIEEEETVTMTGGMGTEIVTAVLQYSMTGNHVSLPSLTIGRYAHACGHFTNSNGAIVSRRLYLVI